MERGIYRQRDAARLRPLPADPRVSEIRGLHQGFDLYSTP
jgi:hypothetical protein